MVAGGVTGVTGELRSACLLWLCKQEASGFSYLVCEFNFLSLLRSCELKMGMEIRRNWFFADQKQIQPVHRCEQLLALQECRGHEQLSVAEKTCLGSQAGAWGITAGEIHLSLCMGINSWMYHWGTQIQSWISRGSSCHGPNGQSPGPRAGILPWKWKMGGLAALLCSGLG